MTDLTLTEEQKRGIDTFVRWYQRGLREGFGERPVFRLSGPAGSGKSTLAAYALEAAGLNIASPEVLKVAPTGKAALVMRSKGLADAMTLHKAMYLPVDNIGEMLQRKEQDLKKLREDLALFDHTRELSPHERTYAEIEAKIEEVVAEMRQLEESDTGTVSFVPNPDGPILSAEFLVCDEGSMLGGSVLEDLEDYRVPSLYIGDQFQLPVS